MIHNTDDHLRNHGFFLVPNGLVLSPAYDINPVPDRAELSLAINEVDTHCDVQIAMKACKDYGVSAKDADRVLREVRDAVATWPQEAAALQIPRAEQTLMIAAFAV